MQNVCTQVPLGETMGYIAVDICHLCFTNLNDVSNSATVQLGLFLWDRKGIGGISTSYGTRLPKRNTPMAGRLPGEHTR